MFALNLLLACVPSAPGRTHRPEPVEATGPTGDTAPVEIPSCPGLEGARVCYTSDAQPCPQLVLGFFPTGTARLQVFDQDCLLASESDSPWACTGVGQVTVDDEVDRWDDGRRELVTASWGLLTEDACR